MADKVHVGLVSRTFFNLPLWAAMENGGFAAENLDVTTAIFGNVSQLFLVLLSKSYLPYGRFFFDSPAETLLLFGHFFLKLDILLELLLAPFAILFFELLEPLLLCFS